MSIKKNYIFLAVSVRAMVLLASLFSTILLAKFLSPADLSMYMVSISAIGLIVLASQSGVGQITISRISKAVAIENNEDVRHTASSSIALVSLNSIAAVFIAINVLKLVNSKDALSFENIFFVLVAGIVCSLAVQLIDLLRAQQRLAESILLAAQPMSGGLIPSVIFLLAFSLYPGDKIIKPHEYVYLSFVFGWIILFILCSLRVARPIEMAPSLSNIKAQKFREVFEASRAVGFSAACMFVITQMDLWVVYYYCSKIESASYGLANSLVRYVSAANILLGALLPGLVGELWVKGEKDKLEKVLRNAAKIGAAFATVAVATVFFMGKELLGAAFGSDYSSAWHALVALSVGHLINSMLGYSQLVLVTTDNFKAIFFASTISVAFTAVGLVLVTPVWGTLGAAYISAIGLGLYGLTSCVYCFRKTGLRCDIF